MRNLFSEFGELGELKIVVLIINNGIITYIGGERMSEM